MYGAFGSSANVASASGARVFTVPSGQPFLYAVARAVLSGQLSADGKPPSPLQLPDITLLLPTRRATRSVQEAFLSAAGGRALTLPQIRPISASEEDATLLAGLAGPGTLGTDGLDLPPAASEIERRLVLTMLVQRWSQTIRGDSGDAAHLSDHAAAAGANTPAQAAHLAAELARLMDMIETENVPLDRLASLVPDEYAAHWQDTLDFLKIITAFWPAHLESHQLLSPAERRNRAILLEAERLAKMPPKGPVIVAGVTGSVPATVELMRVVSQLPQGTIVLPGLDLYLDADSWTAIGNHPEHPQFGFHKLLSALGVQRADVQTLAGAEPLPTLHERDALISEMMRPSSTTAKWRQYIARTNPDAVKAALQGVSLIEAPTAQDEAEAIALILREAAETPERTAALISPDRLLARRVAVRLESWGIRVDDSAGRPFAKTPPGTFLDLVITAATEDFAPAAVMALLKHPLTRLGLDAFTARRSARALELIAFRDVYLGSGIEGIADALDMACANVDEGRRRQSAVKRLWEADWEAAHTLVDLLREAFAPLTDAFADRGEQSLAQIAEAHIAAAEAICRLPEDVAADDGSSPLWREEAGRAGASFFAGLIDPDAPQLSVRAADYADLYRSLISAENVRQHVAVHPRLAIWGPFEARLQQPDVVILGSLNDGTWPEAADPGPWLNRPMRAELGLPSPEEKIGYAAHDFTSQLGARRVYLTRAEKVDGVPTVPSRWLMRMQALLSGLGVSDALHSDKPWLGWARMRDNIQTRVRINAPAPCPPVEMRPRRISVTRIDRWLANPYAIFASEILKLEPLPALGADPSSALRGSVVHEIMNRFANRYADRLPDDISGELVVMAREALANYAQNPRIRAFWQGRFERFATWFAEQEPQWRAGMERIVSEVSGKLIIEAPAGPFTLSARADRIDIHANGIVIVDYKTGGIPKKKAVLDGTSPQLSLEAAIAQSAEGFARVPRGPIAGVRYVRATGAEPPGEQLFIGSGDTDLEPIVAAVLQNVTTLISRFDDAGTPYRALRRTGFDYTYDDFAHLARVAEWSMPGDEEETEA